MSIAAVPFSAVRKIPHTIIYKSITIKIDGLPAISLEGKQYACIKMLEIAVEWIRFD